MLGGKGRCDVTTRREYAPEGRQRAPTAIVPLVVRRSPDGRLVFSSPALPGWGRAATGPTEVARAVDAALCEVDLAAYAARRQVAYDAAHLADPVVEPMPPGRRCPDPWPCSMWTPLPDGRWRSPTGRVYRADAAVVRRVVRRRAAEGLPVAAPVVATG